MNQGVVIVAGGLLLARAAQTESQLRAVGCSLPIEFWHLAGEQPASSDSREVAARNGWAAKPYAVDNSVFDEVLLLDAGLNIERDPTPLFDLPEYERGALFWRDRLTIKASALIWKDMGLSPRDVQSFDSGQLVIDKRKNAASLAKVVEMNDAASKYHELLYGDKDTWLMGWLATGGTFAVCPVEPQYDVYGGWTQCDWAAKPMFHHAPSFSAGSPNKPGLSNATYKLKGTPVLRMTHSGIAKPELGGIAGGERTVDRVTPLAGRKDKNGRLRK